jgi:hypothetical protein
VVAALVIFPSLALLYVLDQRNVLSTETTTGQDAPPPGGAVATDPAG